jgi:hypothetical protein
MYLLASGQGREAKEFNVLSVHFFGIDGRSGFRDDDG